MKNLRPEILNILSKKLPLKKGTIRKEVSMLSRQFPQATSNARAQILALRFGSSILQKLDREDKATLPSGEAKIYKPEIIRTKKILGKQKSYFSYSTNDFFVKGHINELNRAFGSSCYTCVFILARKIIENLIIAILRKKFPSDQDLYWNKAEGRHNDFSIVLDNLYMKREKFGIDKQIVERLYGLAKPFKKDGNNKTHSLYHLVKEKNEVKNSNIQFILNLIVKLEASMKMR